MDSKGQQTLSLNVHKGKKIKKIAAVLLRAAHHIQQLQMEGFDQIFQRVFQRDAGCLQKQKCRLGDGDRELPTDCGSQ